MGVSSDCSINLGRKPSLAIVPNTPSACSSKFLLEQQDNNFTSLERCATAVGTSSERAINSGRNLSLATVPNTSSGRLSELSLEHQNETYMNRVRRATAVGALYECDTHVGQTPSRANVPHSFAEAVAVVTRHQKEPIPSRERHDDNVCVSPRGSSNLGRKPSMASIPISTSGGLGTVSPQTQVRDSTMIERCASAVRASPTSPTSSGRVPSQAFVTSTSSRASNESLFENKYENSCVRERRASTVRTSSMSSTGSRRVSSHASVSNTSSRALSEFLLENKDETSIGNERLAPPVRASSTSLTSLTRVLSQASATNPYDIASSACALEDDNKNSTGEEQCAKPVCVSPMSSRSLGRSPYPVSVTNIPSPGASSEYLLEVQNGTYMHTERRVTTVDVLYGCTIEGEQQSSRVAVPLSSAESGGVFMPPAQDNYKPSLERRNTTCSESYGVYNEIEHAQLPVHALKLNTAPLGAVLPQSTPRNESSEKRCTIIDGASKYALSILRREEALSKLEASSSKLSEAVDRSSKKIDLILELVVNLRGTRKKVSPGCNPSIEQQVLNPAALTPKAGTGETDLSHTQHHDLIGSEQCTTSGSALYKCHKAIGNESANDMRLVSSDQLRGTQLTETPGTSIKRCATYGCASYQCLDDLQKEPASNARLYSSNSTLDDKLLELQDKTEVLTDQCINSNCTLSNTTGELETEYVSILPCSPSGGVGGVFPDQKSKLPKNAVVDCDMTIRGTSSIVYNLEEQEPALAPTPNSSTGACDAPDSKLNMLHNAVYESGITLVPTSSILYQLEEQKTARDTAPTLLLGASSAPESLLQVPSKLVSDCNTPMGYIPPGVYDLREQKSVKATALNWPTGEQLPKSNELQILSENHLKQNKTKESPLSYTYESLEQVPLQVQALASDPLGLNGSPAQVSYLSDNTSGQCGTTKSASSTIYNPLEQVSLLVQAPEFDSSGSDEYLTQLNNLSENATERGMNVNSASSYTYYTAEQAPLRVHAPGTDPYGSAKWLSQINSLSKNDYKRRMNMSSALSITYSSIEQVPVQVPALGPDPSGSSKRSTQVNYLSENDLEWRRDTKPALSNTYEMVEDALPVVCASITPDSGSDECMDRVNYLIRNLSEKVETTKYGSHNAYNGQDQALSSVLVLDLEIREPDRIKPQVQYWNEFESKRGETLDSASYNTSMKQDPARDNAVDQYNKLLATCFTNSNTSDGIEFRHWSQRRESTVVASSVHNQGKMHIPVMDSAKASGLQQYPRGQSSKSTQAQMGEKTNLRGCNATQLAAPKIPTGLSEPLESQQDGLDSSQKNSTSGIITILSMTSYELKLARMNNRRIQQDPYGSQARLSAGICQANMLGRRLAVVPGKLPVNSDINKRHCESLKDAHQNKLLTTILAKTWRKETLPSAPIEEPRNRSKSRKSKRKVALGLTNWRSITSPVESISGQDQSHDESSELMSSESSDVEYEDIPNSHNYDTTMWMKSTTNTMLPSTYDGASIPTQKCESVSCKSSTGLGPSHTTVVQLSPAEEKSPLWQLITGTDTLTRNLDPIVEPDMLTRKLVHIPVADNSQSGNNTLALVKPVQVVGDRPPDNSDGELYTQNRLSAEIFGISQVTHFADIYQRSIDSWYTGALTTQRKERQRDGNPWLPFLLRRSRYDPYEPIRHKPPNPHDRGDITWEYQYHNLLGLELLVHVGEQSGRKGYRLQSRGVRGKISYGHMSCKGINKWTSNWYQLLGSLGLLHILRSNLMEQLYILRGRSNSATVPSECLDQSKETFIRCTMRN